MALLTKYAMGNETFKKIFGTKTYKSDSWDYPWKNKHKLVTSYYEFATGEKQALRRKLGERLLQRHQKVD